jgi:integrase
MTAHQWRHVVGYIFLCSNPGAYEPVRRLLGHKRIETTMNYYTFMLDTDAQEKLEDTFEGLRQRREGAKRSARLRERDYV